jgi:hypothetical protein
LGCESFSQAQAGPHQAGLQAYCLLKKLDAFRDTPLLQPDGSQHGARRRAGVRIGKSNMRLTISIVQASLLNQVCSVL